jgi:hypothetical protein
VHVGGEGVGNCLFGTGGNLNRVLVRGKVLEDLRLAIDLLDQRTTDNGDANGGWLLIVDGETCLGGVAVDKLDAEDLRLRERDGYGDVEVWRLRLLYDFLDLLDLSTRVSNLMSCRGEIKSLPFPLHMRLQRAG